jgi:hypothetical protein
MNAMPDAGSTALTDSMNFDQLLEIASSGIPGTTESGLDFDELSLLDPDITLASLRDSEDIVELQPGCDRVVSLFQDSMFLREIDTSQLHSTLNSRSYLSLHPLVPMMVRASRGWQVSRLHFIRGFSGYITKRLQDWPINNEYYNPVWAVANEEADLEFFNFSGGALMFLHECDSFIKYSAFMKTLRCLSHGTLKDPGRERVLLIVWELALELLQRQESALNSIDPSKQENSSDMLKTLPWSLSTSPDAIETRDLDLGVDVPTMLFQVRFQVVTFAMLLMTFHYHINSAAQAKYLTLAEHAHAEIFAAGVPKDQGPELMRAQLDYNLLVARTAGGKVDVSPDELWESREGRNAAMDSRYGVEKTDGGGKGFLHLPLDKLGPAARFAHFIPLSMEIRHVIDQGKATEARRLVDEALLREINDAGNDSMNKASLMRYLAEIDKMQGKELDATKHLREAAELEQAARLGWKGHRKF